jgi:site-specific DNA recombinase
MVKSKFVMTHPYRVVVYLRMSTDQQNERSPDQQLATINELIRRLNLPWKVVREYRDVGISGRFVRKRLGYQQMLRDLRSGEVQADLVLVDTFERLSRAEDSAEIRKQLKKIGVLVLTADSGFQDPTSEAGQVLSMMQAYRSTSEARVKGHNVNRGKRDAVKLGHWPGGPVPFGFRLKNTMKVDRGVESVDYRTIEPIPELVWIVELIFSMAVERAWGGGRISCELNANPEIPEKLKPFLDTNVDYILRNRLYYGEMVWGANCTDIVDDSRIVEEVPEDEWTVNSQFCEAIIPKSVWEQAEQIRLARQRMKTDLDDDQPGGFGRRDSGVALKYPLSGFVACATCGRAMVVSSGAPYTTASGEERRYPSYRCPGSKSDACSNKRSVPEPWLRETVVRLIRQRMFLSDSTTEASNRPNASSGRPQCLNSDGLREFVEEVRLFIEATRPDATAVSSRLLAEQRSLEERCRGWRMSLGDPNIPLRIRNEIQSDYADASRRISDIERRLMETQSHSNSIEEIVNLESASERLERLASLLEGENASAINVALAQHIDSICCHSDGTVRLRMCTLGALANPLEIGRVFEIVPKADSSLNLSSADPRRRRTLRRVGAASEVFEDFDLANYLAVDVNRFAGLGEEWFTVDEFQIEPRQSWTRRNARDVAEYRLRTHATVEKTAEHFGVTSPTILAALKYAKTEHGLDAQGRRLSNSTWSTWSRLNARQVAEFLAQPGATKQSAAIHFDKAVSTIESALRIAGELQAPASSTGSE